MTQIENGFYEVIAMAKKLETEGVCKVYYCEDSSTELRFSINWNIQSGEEFVKASALARIVSEWADFADGEDGYITYGMEDDYTGRLYMIDVFCVWL